jgi:hypothetical protein
VSSEEFVYRGTRFWRGPPEASGLVCMKSGVKQNSDTRPKLVGAPGPARDMPDNFTIETS